MKMMPTTTLRTSSSRSCFTRFSSCAGQVVSKHTRIGPRRSAPLGSTLCRWKAHRISSQRVQRSTHGSSQPSTPHDRIFFLSEGGGGKKGGRFGRRAATFRAFSCPSGRSTRKGHFFITREDGDSRSVQLLLRGKKKKYTPALCAEEGKKNAHHRAKGGFVHQRTARKEEKKNVQQRVALGEEEAEILVSRGGGTKEAVPFPSS